MAYKMRNCVLGLLLVTVAVSSEKHTGGSAVVDSIEDAPWTVIIEEDDDVILLGAIVGPSLVVTVTRPIRHIDPRNLLLRAGSNQVGKGGSVHNITKVLTHPSASIQWFDVGLVTVSPPFDLDNTRKIIGINRNANTEGEVTVPTYNDDGIFALMTERLLSYTYCNDWYLIIGGVDETMGCLRTPLDLGPCYKDLGTGIVQDGYIIGVLAEYPICYDDEWPSLYTNFTDPFLSMWLQANVPDVVSL